MPSKLTIMQHTNPFVPCPIYPVQARGRQMGLTPQTLTLLKDGGIGTMGAYAFCCGYQPGGVDEAPLIAVLTRVLNAAPDVGLMAVLRRLFYEAHTLAMLDMRNRMDGGSEESSQPRRMQLPERVERMQQLRARYPGFLISGELEFSYALLDKVMDQLDKNQLKYIALEECTRRQQELDGIKKDDILRIEIKKDDSLKLERDHVLPVARLASDLEIRNAFVRRSLAYDAAGLMTFSLFEPWIVKLFRLMQEPAVEGHSPVTLQQAYRADRKLWDCMTNETVSNIIPLLGAIKPLDAALAKFMDHVEVNFLLLPLPLFSNAASSSLPPVPNQIPFIMPNAGKGHQQAAVPKNGPYGKGGKSNKGNGKKGGKGDKTPKLSPMGCAFMLGTGKPCCIFYNGPAGCNNKAVAPGKRCARGFHNCGKVLANKSVCGGEHSMPECTAV